jgi:hypothetical protein
MMLAARAYPNTACHPKTLALLLMLPNSMLIHTGIVLFFICVYQDDRACFS